MRSDTPLRDAVPLWDGLELRDVLTGARWDLQGHPLTLLEGRIHVRSHIYRAGLYTGEDATERLAESALDEALPSHQPDVLARDERVCTCVTLQHIHLAQAWSGQFLANLTEYAHTLESAPGKLQASEHPWVSAQVLNTIRGTRDNIAIHYGGLTRAETAAKLSPEQESLDRAITLLHQRAESVTCEITTHVLTTGFIHDAWAEIASELGSTPSFLEDEPVLIGVEDGFSCGNGDANSLAREALYLLTLHTTFDGGHERHLVAAPRYVADWLRQNAFEGGKRLPQIIHSVTAPAGLTDAEIELCFSLWEPRGEDEARRSLPGALALARDALACSDTAPPSRVLVS